MTLFWPKNLKSNMAGKVAVAKGDVDVEDAGGVFELNDWVEYSQRRQRASPLPAENLHVTRRKFVIYSVIYIIYIHQKSP